MRITLIAEVHVLMGGRTVASALARDERLPSTMRDAEGVRPFWASTSRIEILNEVLDREKYSVEARGVSWS